MEIIKDKTFDEERALYHTIGAEIENCTFAGPADGESVLKEARKFMSITAASRCAIPCGTWITSH